MAIAQAPTPFIGPRRRRALRAAVFRHAESARYVPKTVGMTAGRPSRVRIARRALVLDWPVTGVPMARIDAILKLGEAAGSLRSAPRRPARLPWCASTADRARSPTSSSPPDVIRGAAVRVDGRRPPGALRTRAATWTSRTRCPGSSGCAATSTSSRVAWQGAFRLLSDQHPHPRAARTARRTRQPLHRDAVAGWCWSPGRPGPVSRARSRR